MIPVPFVGTNEMFPILSLHEFSVVPVVTIVEASAPSNHKAHPGIATGENPELSFEVADGTTTGIVFRVEELCSTLPLKSQRSWS